MKTLILSICLLFGIMQATSQALVIDWQKSYGGIGNDYAKSIAKTGDGGYIMAGMSSSNNGDVSGNHGGKSPPLDFWVVKINASGAIQWQKSLGGTDDETAKAIFQTPDGGYVVAGNSESYDGDILGNRGKSDCWVVKLNSTGDILWKKNLGGSLVDGANAIIGTSDGGYALAGYTDSNDGDVTATHGSGYPFFDFWVVKLSDTGTIQWQKTLGGSGYDSATSIIQATDGGYVITGESYSNNGDVSGNHGNADFWVVKLNSAGAIQWQKSLGGANDEFPNAIIPTIDGGYVIAGSTNSSNSGDVSVNNGGYDYWVVKLNSSGAIQWQKLFGGTLNDYATSITQLSDGSYYISGNSESNNGQVTGNHDNTDCWIVNINSSGVFQFQKSFGGALNDMASSMIKTNDGGLAVAGSSSSIDGDVTGNHGSVDFWLIKLSIAPFSITPIKQLAICTPTATISAVGCYGTVNWYRDTNGAGVTYQFLASGNTLTYTSDVDWRQYIRATCTVNGIVSPYSNYSTVQTGPEVTPLSDIISAGTPITITASGCPAGTTYLWTTGETSPIITKSPSTYTPYFVKCTNNTCQSPFGISYIYVGNVVANNDNYITTINTPISANFCTNDGALSPKTVYVDFPPTHGNVVWDNTGAFTYTPTSGYTGTDSFKYYLNNGAGSFSNYATVTITIN